MDTPATSHAIWGVLAPSQSSHHITSHYSSCWMKFMSQQISSSAFISWLVYTFGIQSIIHHPLIMCRHSSNNSRCAVFSLSWSYHTYFRRIKYSFSNYRLKQFSRPIKKMSTKMILVIHVFGTSWFRQHVKFQEIVLKKKHIQIPFIFCWYIYVFFFAFVILLSERFRQNIGKKRESNMRI